MDDLKGIILMNRIQNTKVTTYDVNLAMKDYGLDVGQIKGKTTRCRLTPFVSSIVEMPKELMEEQQDLTFLMYILTVNSLKLLSTISHKLYYRTSQYITKPVVSIYKGCIEELMYIYNKGGFYITKIYSKTNFAK